MAEKSKDDFKQDLKGSHRRTSRLLSWIHTEEKLVEDFYEYLDTNNYLPYLYQFNNKLSAYQYALPYQISFRYLKPSQRVLDWGCGNGHFFHFLLNQGYNTVACSFDGIPESIAKRKAKNYSYKLLQNPLTLNFNNTYFDAVFSIGVLEHVHESSGDQEKSLLEISRVLKKGGHFLCFHLPNTFSWVEILIEVIYRLGFKIHGSEPHSKRYGFKALRELCNKTNFKIIEIGYYNFLPRNLMKRILPQPVQKKGFQKLWEILDKVFSKYFSLFCSQIYFIAQKK